MRRALAPSARDMRQPQVRAFAAQLRSLFALHAGRIAEFNAICEGTTEFNGFYGHGIVDAYATVTETFDFAK